MVSKVAPFDPSGSAMSTVAGKTVISAGPARKSESFEDTSSLSQSVVVSFSYRVANRLMVRRSFFRHLIPAEI
jgi:hypothetical protein